MWAAVPVLEPEPRGWVGKNMSLSIKGILLSPEGHSMWKTWKDAASKGREQNPAHSRAEEACVFLGALPCLLYTIRDVKELVCTLVSNNNDHDIYSGVWPKAFWDYSSMPVFILEPTFSL